jgi:hypothetical protein
MSECVVGVSQPTSVKLPFKMFDRKVPEIFSRQACPESNRRAAKLAKNPEIPLSSPFDKGERGGFDEAWSR